jgi:hypothetical protein
MRSTRLRWSGPLLLATLLGCSGPAQDDTTSAALTATITPVAPIGGGNAMTLPAQRHLVRMTPSGTPRWLLAVQQDRAGNGGLQLFRSDDDARSFHYYKPIQPDASERDTAELIAVGNDVAMVYSWEGPVLTGSTRHDVYFQWWRHAGGDWTPAPALRIFDSTSSSSAYYRAELARDSLGRLWVQAFRLEANGSATARIAVSTDGGASFQIQPDLGTSPAQGGGRLLALGTRMVFVWDDEGGVSPARFRTRDDAAPVGTWSATQLAFSEGIYHGAALSAVADGGGGMHLVYKDKNSVLWYRRFDGSSFGAAQQVENQGNWELQPAVTRVGSDLWIFYNRVITTSFNDQLRVRVLSGGVLGAPSVLDGTVSFKGYPAAIDVLAAGTPLVPCLWGVTPDANSMGTLQLYSVATGAAPPPPPPPPDMAAPPDSGGTTGTLFSDSFARTIPPNGGLGPQWTVAAGFWYMDGRAVSDLDGSNLAAENVAGCRDCTVQARVLTFGTTGGVYLRAPSPGATDRYDLVLLANGRLQLRRVRSGSATVLGDVPSGVDTTASYVTLTLSASGSSPVALVGRVNGSVVLSVSDGSSAALGSGFAGLWTLNAGVVFRDFVLRQP